MGGSLAYALQDHCAGMVAYDPDLETRHFAERMIPNIRVIPDADAVILQSDVLILAAPVRGILAWIEHLKTLPGHCVVLDIGSTKTKICEALSLLPSRYEPVGGHPMCGKETAGVANASSDIFLGAPFALVASINTTERARNLAEEIVAAAGAQSIWLEADIHDQWVAATSHLPYLLSAALVHTTQEEAKQLVGSGFRSMARLAGSDPRMMRDIILTNRKYITAALKHLEQILQDLAAELDSDDDENLMVYLDKAQNKRRRLVE